jgi:inosine/xanthosine triphosphate pyrophosphatase family protein
VVQWISVLIPVQQPVNVVLYLRRLAGPDDEPHLFVGRTQGTIVAARGPSKFGWDPIFLPDGFDNTYAEMDKQTKNGISHRCVEDQCRC